MKLSHPVLMTSAMSLGGAAAAINTDAFEGGVLEIRQSGWASSNCYSTVGDLTQNGTYPYQSSKACKGVADANNAKVFALGQGKTCYYGNDIPPDSDKVDMSECNVTCDGYPGESCGGQNTFLFWTDGSAVGSSGSSSNSGSSPSTTPTPTPATASTPVVVSTIGGTTVIITPTADSVQGAATVQVSSPAKDDSGSGTNKAAVAAGVVVGVVGLAAIIGGALLFLRSRKQRREAAELHRQNSAAGFISRAEKPPSTYSQSDSRLEPAFMRRMSDGSIADNQDYSRRILKVTNPDDR